MKVALLESVKKIIVKDVPKPEIGKGSILLRVRACGICGSDIKFFNYGDRVKSFPAIIGHEIAGEIAEVGSGVDFRPGDRLALGNEIPCRNCPACRQGYENVCDNLQSIGTTLPGGLAEYMLLNAEVVSRGPINRIPDNVDFDAATLAEPLGCIVNGFEFARMSAGKSVLIVGAGPIGCMMINLAQILGASKIVAVDALEKRIKLAGQFGADYYIRSKDFLSEALKISPHGYDVVMSATNSAQAHEHAIKASAKGGFVNLFGGVPKGSDDRVNFQVNQMHYRQFAIGGSFSQTKLHHKKALKYLESGRILTKKLITHKFPLGEVEKAFDVVAKKEGLKIIVNP